MKKIFMLFLLLSICVSAQSSLRYMYFLDENIGWVQTTEFPGYTPIKSYRTSNGGITWTQLDSQYNYKSIQFVNDSIGFLLSGRSNEYRQLVSENLYKTTDKGETWLLIALLDSTYGKVEFANENIGYALSYYEYSPQILYRTTDGGITWNSLSNFSFCTLKVIDENRIALVDYSTGTVDRLFRLSTDYGETWTVLEFLPIYGEYNTMDVIFNDSMNGFITVQRQNYQDEFEGFRHTTDGGITWKWIKVNNYYGCNLSMSDSENGLLYGGIALTLDYGYYITHDAFQTWEYKFCDSLVREYLYKSCKEFYASGDSGYFAKSTNCGDTWTEIPFVILNPTDVDENNSTITNYSLEQNYPNPFNPSTRIKYSLPVQSFVKISVHNVLGEEVKLLVNGNLSSGYHEVNFDASSLSSGLYMYKIEASPVDGGVGFTSVKKMMLMK